MSDADAMTGTSGPRHAVRRPNEVSPLMRGLDEMRPQWSQAVQEAMRELNPSGTRRSVPARELDARVAAKLGIDEQTAHRIVKRFQEQQRSAQRS